MLYKVLSWIYPSDNYIITELEFYIAVIIPYAIPETFSSTKNGTHPYNIPQIKDKYIPKSIYPIRGGKKHGLLYEH